MKVNSLVMFALITVSLSMSGCIGTIRSHHKLEQPTGSVLTTGVGGTVFRLNKTGDLPNVYGGRDFWGGKINKGFAEMKLAGIEGSVLVLEIIDVNKHSSETTMDRYNEYMPFKQNAVINVDVVNTTTIGNQQQAKPYIVRFDTDKQSDIVISSIRVIISEVQPYSIQYSLESMLMQ
tara:strand:- start:1869 stop:2399 length:531 start_codon:yes stop_codon:yes gene_type:complete